VTYVLRSKAIQRFNVGDEKKTSLPSLKSEKNHNTMKRRDFESLLIMQKRKRHEMDKYKAIQMKRMIQK
jgi:hypothetical protein